MRQTFNRRKKLARPGASAQGRSYPSRPPEAAELRETLDATAKVLAELPASDNSEGAVEKMLRANAILRNLPWPKPLDETIHRLRGGDASDMSWLPDESIHLVVTSPPYWTPKEWEGHPSGGITYD